jgi:soluble lytic murein transglycosylase-like protein
VSVESIGTRIAAIQAQLQAVQSGVAPGTSTSFADQLAAAQTTGASSPAATTATTAATPSTGTVSGLASTNSTLNGGAPTQYDAQITAAAAKYGIDPALLKGLIRQESNFDPTARSGVGAQGLTQLMPGTASSLGVTDPTDPAQAIDGGAKYLSQQLTRFGGDASKALAAYNAGPGAVQKYGGVPPYAETQNYVQKVLGYAAEYRGAGATTTGSTPLPTQPVSLSAASLLSSAIGGDDTTTDDGTDDTTNLSPSGTLDYSTV